MNEIMVHLVGNVATPATLRMTNGGRPVTSFRLAATPRRYDTVQGWQDLPTSYVTVTCWNGLAENAALSFKVGEPVVAVGRLKVREWEREGRKGQEVEVEALGLGHDLHRGVSIYKKLARARTAEDTGTVLDPSEVPAEPDAPDEDLVEPEEDLPGLDGARLDGARLDRAELDRAELDPVDLDPADPDRASVRAA